MRTLVGAAIAFLITACSGAEPAPRTPGGPCAPPAGFSNVPPPTVAPLRELVAHTEEIVVDLPLAEEAAVAKRLTLEDVIDPNSPLPGIHGTFQLTDGAFGAPGTRRLVCLTDGSTLVEQVLENTSAADRTSFRYVVWNYTSEQARAITYGVGHFVRTPAGARRTRVTWTYAFALRRDRFPGYLGGLGDWLFRTFFLEGDYAAMMKGTLKREKAFAEGNR